LKTLNFNQTIKVYTLRSSEAAPDVETSADADGRVAAAIAQALGFLFPFGHLGNHTNGRYQSRQTHPAPPVADRAGRCVHYGKIFSKNPLTVDVITYDNYYM